MGGYTHSSASTLKKILRCCSTWHFSMCGFEICIVPKIQTRSGEQFLLKDAVWSLANEQTKERTAQAFLRVSDDSKSWYLDHGLF